MRALHIGLLLVMRSNRPPHPKFIPPDLVHAIVMATTIGYAHLVKFTVIEQAPERILPPAEPP